MRISTRNRRLASSSLFILQYRSTYSEMVYRSCRAGHIRGASREEHRVAEKRLQHPSHWFCNE
jgi:hypothetical protein